MINGWLNSEAEEAHFKLTWVSTSFGGGRFVSPLDT